MGCTVLLAQQATGFYIQQFGTEDGLPSNGIKGLQWDKQTGFLWIATEAGMVRYNGMGFKTYTSDDNPSITNERILFLVRNNAGTIYTADNTGNLFAVKKNTLAFAGKNKIAGNPLSNIITLPVSDLFFHQKKTVTHGPFALQFDKALPVSDTAFYIQHQRSLYYFSVSMDGPERLPVLPGKIKRSFICSNTVFLQDTENQVWRMGQQTGLLTRLFLLDNYGRQINISGNHTLYWENGMPVPILTGGEKAWKLTYENEKLVATEVCNQVPADVLIRYIQYDEKSQALFIGTDSKGIIIIRKNRVEQLRKLRTSVSERTSYYSQFELPDGNVITNEGHIIGNNNPAGAVPPFSGPFSISAYQMGDSLFWFMKNNLAVNGICLHRYDLRTKKLTTYPKIKERFSQLVMTYSDGGLYIANEEGVFQMQADSLKPLYRYHNPERQHIHFDMKETAPGILLIANCNALLRYTAAVNRMDTLFSPGNYCVRSIWVHNEYVFFGTYGNGFFVYKEGVVKPMPLDKNRYLQYTHCFIDDGKGYCWISTNRGLFKASIAEMIYAWEKNLPQVYYHYFGRSDGMQMTEMNGGCMPCGLKMRSGTISFPTMEGLLWASPQNDNLVLPDGEIYIDEILVDNKRTSLANLGQSPLPAFKHDIIIRPGFSAWCNKENIYVEYQLGENDSWKPVNVDNGTLIQLNNLVSGDYKLRIRKMNGFGIENYSYKEIKFTIPAPWYQRWWFYLLALLTAWGLLVLYFRYRTRQLKLRQKKLEQQVDEKTKELQEQNEVLEKNNSIKTRLISIISHDIVTPLKFLTVAGKNLQEKRKQMPEELQQETIKEITNTSQELQLLSTNILNWIKYQNENRRLVKETFNLHEMVGQVLGILKSLARQKVLVIENEVNNSLEVFQLYEPLKILLYNLLTNAIHFSEKGAILITASREGNSVIMTVKDEGTGMTPEQVQRLMADEVIITSANVDNKRGHGLGYLIIKDLIKTMGAGLQIKSKKGEGTTVFIRMPAVKNGGA
jgi:signal transduction histidine kinase